MAEEFRRRPLDDWEIAACEDAIQTDHERLAFIVLLHTGIRITEFIRLRKEDVYARREYAVIRSLKSSRNRQVPLTSPQARTLLEGWFSVRSPIGYSAQKWQTTLRRLGKRAGITRVLTPHVLRHSFATQCLRGSFSWLSGPVDIRSLQQALGHSSLSVTERYLVYVEGMGLRGFRSS